MSEVRTLSLHPLAIHTFIKAQAGSLGKALSEAVMNSLDAFATEVRVTVGVDGFVIEDNGQGFRTKEEIASWFETLGFPHDEGNHRLYGKFGMGRAQMWAFASTEWTSNEFIMRVDVKNKGLDYELDYTHEPFKGTRIHADFYENLNFAEVQRVQLELENLVKYVPAAVFVNDKLASKDPSTEEWDLETPQAWMRFDKQLTGLAVYNAGLLVNEFPKYRFGCTGVVVTKPTATLALNLARNEILVAECKVWKAIALSFPKAEAEYRKPKSTKASPKVMEAKARELTAGVKTLSEVLADAPHMLISVMGRPLKRQDLTGWRATAHPVVFVPKGDEFGKRLSKLRMATAVAIESLKNLNCASIAELKAMVERELEAEYSGPHAEWGKRMLAAFRAAVWTDDPAAAFPQLAAGRKVFAMSELQPAEKAVAIAWQRSRQALKNDICSVATEAEQRRCREVYSMMLGDSPMGESSWVDADANAWVLNKKDAVDAMSRSLPVLTRYAVGQLRILCNHVADGAEAGKALFIKVVTETEALGTLMLNLTRFHVYECRQKDLPVQPTRLRELDHLNVE